MVCDPSGYYTSSKATYTLFRHSYPGLAELHRAELVEPCPVHFRRCIPVTIPFYRLAIWLHASRPWGGLYFGQVVVGAFSDPWLKYQKSRHHEDRPEDRLPPLVIVSVLILAGYFWYGKSTQYHTH